MLIGVIVNRVVFDSGQIRNKIAIDLDDFFFFGTRHSRGQPVRC